MYPMQLTQKTETKARDEIGVVLWYKPEDKETEQQPMFLWSVKLTGKYSEFFMQESS